MNKQTTLESLFGPYKEITIRYEAENASLWCYFNPAQQPNFTMTMLQELYHFHLSLIEYFKSNNMHPTMPVHYLIIASQTTGVFNYGGDLNLFSKLIIEKEEQKLYEYAKICIDLIHLRAVNMNLPITTISLVEGTALGGGFEAALSSDIIIADKNAKFGLPEIRFNLFPGMGAFSLLARSLNTQEAENIISSGEIYDAQTLYDKGLIQVLAEPQQIRETLDKFIAKHSKSFNGLQAIRQARIRYENLQYDELLDITKIWVDAALRLKERDLKIMKKLTKIQSIKADNNSKKSRTKQDRRVLKTNITYPFLDANGVVIQQDRRSNSDRRA